METYIGVTLIAIIAGALSGIVGTGSSLLLLPLMVGAFGPKSAIPIMAVAAIVGNLSRIAVWWREIDWRATLAYILPGVPAASLGAHVLLALPAWTIDCALGIFFWIMIPVRRHLKKKRWTLSIKQLGFCGGFVGFLTGLVLSTGPVSVPIFTAYGLSGGAFIGTEAASALLLYMSKAGTFAFQDALSMRVALTGVLVGGGILLGTLSSKALVRRLSATHFSVLIDVILFISGAGLMCSAWSEK
ncbi:sulfite exporter TauE/SafE family protein [Enterobacter sp. R1(2018)]|uniref:sulfite exporter TauE/SafE family protein n=1 Tax=Enterobacter sp. R1(2018) TaxID=2447891 RepID=UPI000EB1EE13|nr:sulfite exporter TauE/SafE family protein [Enterobacter sp. R1(2018)]RKQ39130.1 sulfite exporter TauE/SafE family protein [Enterobacter sp. R1(2018)]